MEIYANGISTSLPADVQIELVRSIKGLEEAEIMRPGYAIEYDFIPPTQIKHTLETKLIEGLYNAGQINGTSGYEEAAAQGIIAGINAALKIQGKETFILDRSEAYIGVLIDDLVTKGTQEPYRMFTSRAEYRLLLRHDNADSRLTERGYRIGLVSVDRYKKFEEAKNSIEQEISRLKKIRAGNLSSPLFTGCSDETVMSQGFTNGDENPACHPICHPEFISGSTTMTGQLIPKQVRDDSEKGNSVGKIKPGVTLSQLLQRPEMDYGTIEKLSPSPQALSNEEKKRVEIEVKYEGYIKRQLQLIERYRDMEKKRIPDDFDYSKISGLSHEVIEKLLSIRPVSLGQASRIPGITPAAVSIIAITIAKRNRSKDM